MSAYAVGEVGVERGNFENRRYHVNEDSKDQQPSKKLMQGSQLSGCSVGLWRQAVDPTVARVGMEAPQHQSTPDFSHLSPTGES